MAVNWFEGGRRISKLFITLVALGGAAYVAMSSTPMGMLETEPGADWTVATSECKMTDHSEYKFDYDWGGDKTGLEFCFRATEDGKIPYAVAPTPPVDARRYAEEVARLDAEDKARIARGEPPPLRTLPEKPVWFYTADEFSPEVTQYAKQRVADFKLTKYLQQELTRTESRRWWVAKRTALSEAFYWVLGLCAFIWVFTAVMGWIVRGFAGVPSGQDYRQPKPEA